MDIREWNGSGIIKETDTTAIARHIGTGVEWMTAPLRQETNANTLARNMQSSLTPMVFSG